jgi:hypothetical protein
MTQKSEDDTGSGLIAWVVGTWIVMVAMVAVAILRAVS